MNTASPRQTKKMKTSEPAKPAVRPTLPAGTAPLSIATAAGHAWISNWDDGELWRVKTTQP